MSKHVLLRPDMIKAADKGMLADLTPAEWRVRIDNLVQQSHDIMLYAIEKHLDNHALTGIVVLISGGNDSTVLAHIIHRRLRLATHLGHANTGIGVPETNQFVRDVAAQWNIPLIEKHPPRSYDDIVMAQGFPGAGMHYYHYQRLKERCTDAIRADLVDNPRRERVMFAAGRRRTESARRGSTRMNGSPQVPFWERDGSTIWSSPIALWTKTDLVMYRAQAAEDGDPVPFNPVTDHLGMSGECLCGAYAKPGELDRLRVWYPDVAARIEALQARVVAAGFSGPRACWGHGLSGKDFRATELKTGKMCSSCELPSA